jgi:hypothetical protein
MLKKLRIGPKLLLAPGLVLVLLTMLSAAAYYGMVRQNDSLEHMVQVRAHRLQSVADVAGDARFAHANIYQLLAWVNGSFAASRLAALTDDIHKKHAAIGAKLGELSKLAEPSERTALEGSLAALASYRKLVAETIELAQVDQSIATNSKGGKAVRCARHRAAAPREPRKKAERRGARRRQRRVPLARDDDGRPGDTVDRAVAGGDNAGAPRHAG